MIFRNRKHAGELLSERLSESATEACLILALPRGGVPIASEISQNLHLPWDILAVRKIGAPLQPELAVGALCEDDEALLNDSLISHLNVDSSHLDRLIAIERAKINRQIQIFRASQKLGELSGQCVIVVDDGLATGATALAAISYIRKKNAKRIVFATPVAAASSARRLRRQIDQLVALEEREDLFSVSQWYENFDQVPDEEVLFHLDQRDLKLRKVGFHEHKQKPTQHGRNP